MKEPSIVQFNFRCPEALVELIDKDNELTGEFRNRSEWVLQAIRQFLDYRTKIIAERQAAFSKEQDSRTSKIGSVDRSASTEGDASSFTTTFED